MYTLTTDEVELLTKNQDPKIAAVALKLKESEEKGEFVPKSRLVQVLTENKELSAKQQAILDMKKLEEEEKAKKNGEFETLLKTRDEELAKAKAQFDEEKKIADEHRTYHKSVIEEVKKQLGDKWNDEFSKLSLKAISELPGVIMPKIGVDNGTGGQPPTGPKFTREQVKAMSQKEVSDNLKDIEQSMKQWK